MPKKKTSKLRKSAKGEECTLQIHPYCNGNSETVVLCHLPSEDHGMGFKSPDWWAVYGCSACHDIIDGRNELLTTHEKLRVMMRGLYRTQKRMREKGLISE